MDKYILECCVDSVESAINAEIGGADRLELCSNLIIGGTTPTLALYNEVRKHTSIPIHILIRPRFGDFLYSESEVAIIQNEICQFRKAGADGVVIGSLTPNGNLHMEQMKSFMAYTGSMHVTLHRAFDMCANPLHTLQDAIQLHIDTILTSGHAQSWKQGLPLLKQLDTLTKNLPLQIMAGAGIDEDAVKTLLTETNLHCFHMSGKHTLESNMMYRNPNVNMGVFGFSEYQIIQTSAAKVAAVKSLLS